MTHRPPTRADIGKQVEFSDDGENWEQFELRLMSYGREGRAYFTGIDEGKLTHTLQFCRVPVHSPDPIAELLVAADQMADQGLDEAARVLMLWLTLAEVDRQRLNLYRDGDSITVWSAKLNEFQLARLENPPPVREPKAAAVSSKAIARGRA